MSLSPHCVSSGLPTVLENPCNRRRFHDRVYAAFHVKFELKVVGAMLTVIDYESERRFDRMYDTLENLSETRASPAAIDPVVGTMLVGSTNTGRFASSANANRS